MCIYIYIYIYIYIWNRLRPVAGPGVRVQRQMALLSCLGFGLSLSLRKLLTSLEQWFFAERYKLFEGGWLPPSKIWFIRSKHAIPHSNFQKQQRTYDLLVQRYDCSVQKITLMRRTNINNLVLEETVNKQILFHGES